MYPIQLLWLGQKTNICGIAVNQIILFAANPQIGGRGEDMKAMITIIESKVKVYGQSLYY